MDENVTLFLDDLSALTRRHGIRIGACGCCQSPYIDAETSGGRYEVQPDEIYGSLGNNLKWVCTDKD